MTMHPRELRGQTCGVDPTCLSAGIFPALLIGHMFIVVLGIQNHKSKLCYILWGLCSQNHRFDLGWFDLYVLCMRFCWEFEPHDRHKSITLSKIAVFILKNQNHRGTERTRCQDVDVPEEGKSHRAPTILANFMGRDLYRKNIKKHASRMVSSFRPPK